MKRSIFSTVLAVFCFCLPLAAQAETTPAQAAAPVHVVNAYAFETAVSQANGAIFMEITNESVDADALIGASSDVSSAVELHTSSNDDGTMSMRPVERMELPGGSLLVLEPSGDHIMLLGLHAPLQAGQNFPLTLHFEHGGDVSVAVDVISLSETPVDAEAEADMLDHAEE